MFNYSKFYYLNNNNNDDGDDDDDDDDDDDIAPNPLILITHQICIRT